MSDSNWRVYLFGTLEAVAPDGKIVVWRETKAGALLACLAVQPNLTHSRESLAERL